MRKGWIGFLVGLVCGAAVGLFVLPVNADQVPPGMSPKQFYNPVPLSPEDKAEFVNQMKQNPIIVNEKSECKE